MEKGVYALMNHGRSLYLECQASSAEEAKPLLERYLADSRAWKKYAGKGNVAIAFGDLNPIAQRAVILTLFPNDTIDSRGWTHVVRFADKEEGHETLWSLCEWLAGNGTQYKEVMAANNLKDSTLRPGQRIFIPARMLRDGMKAPIRKGPLTYEGRYALYTMKPGDTLYSTVVSQFADTRDNASILKACNRIQQASGIKNAKAIRPGMTVRIPVDMLAARFNPTAVLPGHAMPNDSAEPAIIEARRRAPERPGHLKGVVVVLDPGHGGRDHGTDNVRYGLYEDELAYDIVCRIKRVLESRTQATVYVTMRDRSQGYTPVSRTRFYRDTDEEMLTTPRYSNTNARVSVNLRWYLANSIYRRELKAGTDKERIVFASIHCDKRPANQRGAMVYIPGARYRRSEEALWGETYNKYREVKEQRYARSIAAERRRDEGLSRAYAQTLIDTLGKRRVRRHLENDPIRSQIHNGGKEYLPAVLRNTLIPTKVLIETANLNNPTDCSRVADPDWRQLFAEALVDSLERHYSQ
jgi:N-acetylmuramoyl-L-alanine amidase